MSHLLFPFGSVHPSLLELRCQAVPESIPERVRLSPQVRICLETHQHLGQYCTGPLYGHQQGGTLHVAYAAPAGYLYGQDADSARFAPDPDYLRRWTNALRNLYPEPIDWVGTWLSCPDTLLPSLFTQADLIRQARKRPFGTDPFALLFTGKSSAGVVVQAYHTRQGQATPLGVEWRRIRAALDPVTDRRAHGADSVRRGQG